MRKHLFRVIGSTAAFAAVVGAGLLVSSQNGRADDEGNGEDSKIRIGFQINPVQLNMTGKNRDLVGLGSYIVNAQGDCNGCHTSAPATEFVPGRNPYFSQHPAKVNPATFLGGGRDFGEFPGPGPGPGFVHIISRNLTPGKSGLPEGDHTFPQFLQIMRTGVDPDHWHPTCRGTSDGHCVPTPFDGSLLQIMPWPAYTHMRDHDLRAIYEYLSAIPCLEGDPGNPAGADTHGHRCQ